MTQTKFTWHVLQSGPALGGGGPNLDHIRSAQVPSQLAPRYVQLDAGPSWEQWSNGLNAGPNYSCDFVQFAPLNNNSGL